MIGENARSQPPLRPDLEIVVPAYNEAARLPGGLAALTGKLAALPLASTVVVVDNASTDGTGEIARAWRGPVPVRVLDCPRPGKGAAVRAGLLATTAPFAGFCDADMATGLDAVDHALALLAAGHPVVVGSRAHPDSVVQVRRNPVRQAGALAFNRLARPLVGDVGDTQCGFKFFAGPLVREAARRLDASGFAFDVELLARCRLLGGSITEIAVHWRDVAGSRFSLRRHGADSVYELLRIRENLRRAGEVDDLVEPSPVPGPVTP